MKYRILNKDDLYRIQYKILCFWFYYREYRSDALGYGSLEIKQFNSEKNAYDFIKFNKKHKNKTKQKKWNIKKYID